MSKRICMIVFSYYPADPRVRREAEALVDSGFEVDVICLKNENQSRHESVNQVGVYRLPITRKRGNKFRYIWEYISFIIMSFIKVTWLFLLKRYDIVHVHNMPDILILSALVPRMMGSRVILDLHDPMPEVYMTKYSIGMRHPIIRLLLFLEKISISISSIVFTPNIAFQKIFAHRSCDKDKVHVIMNSPDEKIFRFLESDQYEINENQFKVMYHGTIVERHGLMTALEAVDLLKEKIPNLVFHIYGEGDYVDTVLKRIKDRNLEKYVHYHGFVELEQIAQDIQTIDLGLIPNLKTPFTEINMPTRVFEYLSMNKPVIAPRTIGILDYFPENSLFFFNSGDAQDLANVIHEIYSDPDKSKEVLSNGLKVYRNNRWEAEKKKLVNLVTSLYKKQLVTA